MSVLLSQIAFLWRQGDLDACFSRWNRGLEPKCFRPTDQVWELAKRVAECNAPDPNGE